MPRQPITVAAAALLAAALACGGPRAQITPLARASRNGDAAAIRSMVAAGHDVNARDPGGNRWTPLLHAIHKGQRGAIDALLAAGANVHRAVPGERVGVDAAADLTPLLMAVGNGQADIVRRLLAAGADPRTDGPGIFALAVSGGALTDIENPLLGRCNADVVRALLERDPTLRLPRNGRGHLAFLFARLNNCHEVTRLIGFG
jgi:ankyrin repeat protein